MPNYHPAPQAPLSSSDAYTSWPGGIDPTVKLYNTSGGGFLNRFQKFANTMAIRNNYGHNSAYNVRYNNSSRKGRKSRKNRKSRKASRRNRH